MNKKNKVKFNLKNVHFAIKTAPGTYEKPWAHKGAVSLTLDPQGGLEPFYADGIKYYVGSANNGYEGDLEMALYSDDFRTKILQEFIDDNKVMFEDANVPTVEFAFGFQIDGDQHGTFFWYYGCTASRATNEASTVEDSKTPQTESLTLSCAGEDMEVNGVEKHIIRAKSTDETETATWFDEVVMPEVAA